MKSMTKLIVVAMILAAALVVAPVAAARVIQNNGDIIYVGEEKLSFNANFNGPGNGTDITKLIHYSDPSAGSIDKTILVSNQFDLTKSAVGTTTGTYYAFNSVADTSIRTQANGTVFIDIPSVQLDVVLNKTEADRKNTVNGKTVTRDTELIFKFDTNLNGFNGVISAPTMNVEVTLPGGGVTTQFQGVNLKGILMNESTKFFTDNFTMSGAAAGTYTAIGKWPGATDFFGKGFDSNPVSFEVLTKALGITANKDSVVRGNSFSVTITGESKNFYTLEVKGGDAKSPMIVPGQTAVTSIDASGTSGTIQTNAGGTATVQFNTSSNTADKTYTIAVNDTSKNDEVKVKVEAGSVTITTSGTGTYYIGEEITLSGTCTENKTVYLFMTGPNLDTKGVDLFTLKQVPPFVTVDVNADDTWSKKWDTNDIMGSLDAGGYTIYAVSAPKDKDSLSGAKYATASINLRSGFITATTSGATVARGDKLTISGTAQGNPDDVFVWIFGKNFYGNFTSRNLDVHSGDVESDGSFEYELTSGNTENLAAGQYFVIVQHPMGTSIAPLFAGEKAAGSIAWNQNGIRGDGINAVTLTGLQAPAAASALINALDSPNVPDTYVKLTFVVAEPNLFIDPIGTKTAGSKFTISGTTNLAVGDTLNVEVTSAAFQPGSKTEASGFSSSAGNAVVQKGDGANKWSFEVDATSFKPDQYIVKVEAIEAKTTATATFNVVAGGEPTTPPEGNVTTTTTTATTTTATTTTAATPTTTPGFGALVALAGLGAVAFLVLRRK